VVRASVEPKGAARQMDPSHSSSAQVEAGSVVGLWRYPVKSMMGEELNAAEVTDRGLVGDRQFADFAELVARVGALARRPRWRARASLDARTAADTRSRRPDSRPESPRRLPRPPAATRPRKSSRPRSP